MSALDELIDQFAGTVIHQYWCVMVSGGTRLGMRCNCGALDKMVSPARDELAALREEIARLTAKVEKADALASAADYFTLTGDGVSALDEALDAYRSAP